MRLNEENIFNQLIKRYGFFIEELFIEEINEKKFIALNYSEQGVYGVVLSNDANKEIIGKTVYDFMITKGKAFTLNNIVLCDENTNKEYNNFYRAIYIDKNTSKIIGYDTGCEFLVEVITSLNNKPKKISPFSFPSKVTIILMVINIIVFIISALMSKNFLDIDIYTLIKLGAKVNQLINDGEYYRLLTSIFLHGGIMHLVFNMYALYSLGNIIEQVYGVKQYLIIYLTSGIIASYTSYLLSPYISVGASGAIFGLLGGCLVFGITARRKIGKQFFLDISTVIILNIILGFSTPNIDNIAHLGGLVGGIIISIILSKILILKK